MAPTQAHNQDSPDKLLATLSEHAFGFEQMKTLVDPETNVHAQLKQTRADLRALKAQWLLHDSKSRFLEEVKKDGVLDACTDEQLAALQGNRAAAAALRQKKAEIRARSREIRDTVARVAALYADFSARGQEFAAAVEGGRAAAAESERRATEARARAAGGSACFGGSDEALLAMDTEERCQAVLDNQIDAIQRLVEETERVQAEVAALEARAGPMREAADGLARRAEAAEHEAARRTAPAPSCEASTWYASVAALVGGLAGVDATVGEGGAVDFSLRGTGQVVAARFDPATARLTGAEVRPGGFATDDIVRHAVETQAVEFLVREVAARARCAARRADHIRRAVAGLPSAEWSRDSADVTVAFDIGVVCTAYVGFDYPAPHSRLAVRALDGACGWDEADLARIAAEVSAERHADVAAFFARVQERLAAQAREYEEA